MFFDGLADPSTLDERDSRRLHALLTTQLGNSETNWRYYNEGLLSAELWQAHLSYITWYCQQPGFAVYWEVWSSVHSETFRELIERQMLTPSPIPSQLPAAQQSAAADSARAD